MGFYDDDEETNVIPPCHGDDDYYDDTHETCTSCTYNKSCALKIRRQANLANNKTKTSTSSRFVSTSRTESNRIVPKKKEEVAIIEDDDCTFTSALMHNASIEAMQAMVDELANSIRHIPRKSYKNTWKRKKE